MSDNKGVWAKFDEEGRLLSMHDGPIPEDSDILDAVRKVLLSQEFMKAFVKEFSNTTIPSSVRSIECPPMTWTDI